MANNTNNWVTIPNTKAKVAGYNRSKTTEEKEKEKLKYWSWFYRTKVDRIHGTSCCW